MKRHILDRFNDNTRYTNSEGPGSTSITETIETSDPDYFFPSVKTIYTSRFENMEYCNLLDSDTFL